MRILSLGHAFFAAAMIAIGIIGFAQGGFVAVWGGVPQHWPNREIIAYVCDAVALACGLGLLFKPTAGFASRLLFFYLLLWLIVFKLQFVVRAPLEEVSYQSNGETAVIVAAGWVLYVWLAPAFDKRRLAFLAGDTGIRIARNFFGLALIAFGLSHFFYVQMTAPLVPHWLGAPMFWAYFTGAAYLAAGAAVLTDVFAHLAAALTTLQMGLFGVLIWVPLVAAGGIGEFQWGETIVTFVLTASAWVMTDSYRETPWFALRVR